MDSEHREAIKVYPATKPTESSKPTCLDLFAGAGGLAVGFRAADWAVVAGNDIDQDAGATFRLNFPEAVFFEGPISELTAEQILRRCGLEVGALDCLIGGPPCQSFSYNNHQRSEKGERARLFEHYLRIVRGLRPKTIVMENVPGILTIGNGSVVDEIKAALEDGSLGYKTYLSVLSAEEYGTPQVRRRVFIVASRIGDPKELLPAAAYQSADPRKRVVQMGKRLKRIVTVQDAIGDLIPIPNGGGELVMKRGHAPAFCAFQRSARKGTRTLYNHVCHGLTKVNLDRIVHVPEGGNWRDIPRDLLPAGMKRANLTDHTKRYGRLDRKGLASTLLTKCDPHWGAYIHPTQDRTISVREAARLQGFPDTFRFAGTSLGKHYEQVGNAVPVPVARAIGGAVLRHLRSAHEFMEEATDERPEDVVDLAA
ncbi:MAG: DNA cytosine methyltransferase [Pseudomonadota bacterium]|nr:DNA cytosine methyltransferase [Pseudomonadota bacterium]